MPVAAVSTTGAAENCERRRSSAIRGVLAGAGRAAGEFRALAAELARHLPHGGES
jgi:hypothetical protein